VNFKRAIYSKLPGKALARNGQPSILSRRLLFRKTTQLNDVEAMKPSECRVKVPD
jgi:hypothetical protein